jgi:uncharacterized protein YbcI
MGDTHQADEGRMQADDGRMQADEGRMQADEGRMQADEGRMLSAIGRGLAELHTEYYGKGPTEARTYMLNDTAMCILKGGFTTVERTLIADGNSNAVHHIRRSFQAAMEKPFKNVVQGATGRRVVAYMSQTHTDPDLAVELFVLEPTDTPVAGEHTEEIVPQPQVSR